MQDLERKSALLPGWRPAGPIGNWSTGFSNQPAHTEQQGRDQGRGLSSRARGVRQAMRDKRRGESRRGRLRAQCRILFSSRTVRINCGVGNFARSRLSRRPFRGAASPPARRMPAKSRLQPELAAPQFVQKHNRDEKVCGIGLRARSTKKSLQPEKHRDESRRCRHKCPRHEPI
jgi:hypothetical protein